MVISRVVIVTSKVISFFKKKLKLRVCIFSYGELKICTSSLSMVLANRVPVSDDGVFVTGWKVGLIT